MIAEDEKCGHMMFGQERYYVRFRPIHINRARYIINLPFDLGSVAVTLFLPFGWCYEGGFSHAGFYRRPTTLFFFGPWEFSQP